MAIFHALSTAEYSSKTAVVVGLVFAVELAAFALGFLLRRLLPQAYGRYIPFMVCLYEGGMIAYPLYANLCGSEPRQFPPVTLPSVGCEIPFALVCWQKQKGVDFMNSYITGPAIKRFREERKLTQAQLAEKIGVNDKAVSKWETGGSLR